MPRTRRLVPDNGYVHVMCQGNNKQIIFNEKGDFDLYYNLLYSKKAENHLEINHYCLMSNHVHLIIHVTPESNLGRFMKQVNLGYSCYYKSKYNYTGHLFQGRYKSSIIDKEKYLLQCGKYIELNPVRAGYVERPGDYKYSSYNYYAFGCEDRLVSESPGYDQFGRITTERQKHYMDFILDEPVVEMLGTKLYVGDEEFIKDLEGQFSVLNNARKRGRPKKEAVSENK